MSRPHVAGDIAAVVRRVARCPSLVPALCIGTVAALCTPAAFYAMFSGFAPYDDEGYLLIMLRQYSQGAVLYDQLWGHYGPAYFQLLSAAFAALHLDFTHTAGRALTMGLWVCISALGGVTTYRLTRNLPVALCAQMLVFMGLQLRNEPLHPGGLLCFSLSIIVLAGSFLRATPNAAAAVVIGAFLAVAALIKINVGAFAVVSTAFALLAGARVGAGGRFAKRGAAGAMLLVPLVLTASRWTEPWVRVYAWVVCCATLAVLLMHVDRPTDGAAALRDLRRLLIALTLTVGTSCGWALARGTSAAGLLHGILLDPLGQPKAFSVPLVLPPAAPWWALLSVAVGLLVVLARRGWLPATQRLRALHGPAQLLAGAVIWLVALEYLPLSRFAVSLPLLWIPLAARALDSNRDPRSIGKSLLVAVAVLQALHAYPVAGSQTTWASFLFIPVGAIGIAEGWSRTLVAAQRWVRVDTPRFRLVTAGLAAVMVVLTARAAVYEPGRWFKSAYESGVPLNLPGTGQIRISAPWAATYQWLTRNLSSRCKTFVTMPGINSLYLFSRSEPPTMKNNNHWMTLYTASQQAEMRDRFSQAPAPLCVVRNRRLVKFWTQGRDFSDSPLAQYIEAQFVPVATYGGYELMMQRDALTGGKAFP